MIEDQAVLVFAFEDIRDSNRFAKNHSCVEGHELRRKALFAQKAMTCDFLPVLFSSEWMFVVTCL